MDVYRNSWIVLCIVGSWCIVDSFDPYFISRAKILTQKEADVDKSPPVFTPNARKCVKVGEKAARKRISCIADVDFYETFANRIHMSPRRHDDQKQIKELAFKISRCSAHYSKYFERSCKSKSKYLGERRRCRRLRTVQEKSICRSQLRRANHNS